MSEPPRSATIRDVAEKAGVSKSLVSLVLRGAPQVSEARRRAVLAAMEQLDYRPNRAARALTTTRSGTIGVLLNDLRNPWFVDLLEGLTAVLHAGGLAPVLADSYTEKRLGRRAAETLVALGVDGLVVVGSTLESESIVAAAASIPVVLAGTREPQLSTGDIAVDDDEAGGRLATEHLISLGHRRIAHIRGPGIIGELRHAGFTAAMTDANLTADTFTEVSGTSEESGYAVTRRLLAREPRPTAIFAYNDIIAIGAMSAAADVGLRVPEDLSVVGYDDTYLARVKLISLTSVDNGNYALGVQAGKFITDRLSDPGLPARLQCVPTSLHVRTSSAAAPRVLVEERARRPNKRSRG